jgi:hypothetical protein
MPCSIPDDFVDGIYYEIEFPFTFIEDPYMILIDAYQ